jgi:hypothetical protein
MPLEPFARDLGSAGTRDLLGAVDEVALAYGVTPYAAAVRTARLQLVARDDIDAVIEAIQERHRRQDEEAPEGGGGNYYLTTVTRLGPAFIQLVFSALDSQVVSYPGAAGLLGVKVNNFDRLRERAKTRGGAASGGVRLRLQRLHQRLARPPSADHVPERVGADRVVLRGWARPLAARGLQRADA